MKEHREQKFCFNAIYHLFEQIRYKEADGRKSTRAEAALIFLAFFSSICNIYS